MTSRDRAALTRALIRWFEVHARDLPWRRQRNGYTALVAEAMLQQTQVARVVERFQQFIQRFPDIESLASAEEQQVLAMWDGLGYYRRARNLHAAARMIVEEHAGSVPGTQEELLKLPGVGRYTAGSIASIIFGEHQPIVDGNVRRVLARLFANAGASDNADRWAWAQAQNLVNATHSPGAFNEAMMELGATICLPAPASPKCERCPLASFCLARKAGTQGSFPKPRKRVTPSMAFHHSIIFMRNRNREILLQQRGPTGMWANMWQPPTIECRTNLNVSRIRRELGIPITQLTKQGSFQHATTHRTITFTVYRGATRTRKGCWFDAKCLSELPMSSAQRKALRTVMPTLALPASEEREVRAVRSSVLSRLKGS